MNHWFKVEAFVKYKTLILPGWWDISIFVLIIFVDFWISYLFITIKPQTFIRNHTCVSKSQTMPLSFFYLLEVNTIWGLLEVDLDWNFLIQAFSKSKTFFLEIKLLNNGLHKVLRTVAERHTRWDPSRYFFQKWIHEFH